MLSILRRRHLRYVTFPRWPEDGCDWVHPDDAEVAKRLLPGRRVFTHTPTDTEYQIYEYGTESFRALPRMQQRVDGDGLLVGDRVEVKSRLGRRRPIIAKICEMSWNDYHDRIDYRLRYRQLDSRLRYSPEEFQRLIPTDLPATEIEITIPYAAGDDSEYEISPLENLP